MKSVNSFKEINVVEEVEFNMDVVAYYQPVQTTDNSLKIDFSNGFDGTGYVQMDPTALEHEVPVEIFNYGKKPNFSLNTLEKIEVVKVAEITLRTESVDLDSLKFKNFVSGKPEYRNLSDDIKRIENKYNLKSVMK